MKFYNRDGDVIDLQQWMFLHSKPEYTGILADRVSPDLTVSTVWLGIDYGPGYGDFPPLIFETMLFDTAHPTTNQVWRYPTEDAARWGHLKALQEAIQRLDAEKN